MLNPLKSLEKRFPYQFRDNIGIDIARGWANDFVNLCEEIDKVATTDPKAITLDSIGAKLKRNLAPQGSTTKWKVTERRFAWT